MREPTLLSADIICMIKPVKDLPEGLHGYVVIVSDSEADNE